MGRWAKQGFLATLTSKLGFAQTEARVDGQAQVRLHTGFGLKIRERRPIAPGDPTASLLAAPESLHLAVFNGHAPGKNGNSLAPAHNGFTKRTQLAVLEEDGPIDPLDLAGLEFEGKVFDGFGWRDPQHVEFSNGETLAGETLNMGEGFSALSAAASVHEPPGETSPEGDPAPAPTGAADAPAARAEPLPVPADAPNRHAILSGKTVGVVGFRADQSVLLGQALAAQHCSFVILSHAEAEFKKGAANACNL
jgi:hypothetical protein